MHTGAESAAGSGKRPDRQTLSTFRFPPGFLWGAGTSSHQVEGQNHLNDWWEAEQAGRLPYKSGDACRQYELYEQDFDMARGWGHTVHRLSIEWSRCEPTPGTWSSTEIDHYRAVVGALRQRGMEPVVTLHHFTNPAWFARRGGWLRNDSVELFCRYVDRIARDLGDSVHYWITLNEPTVLSKRAFLNGLWPPFHQRKWGEATRVFRNLIRAHRSAYRVLHSLSPQFRVGLAHSTPVIQPCRAERFGDRAVAWLRDLVLNRALLRLAGGNGSRFDFLGLNYYTRTIVRRGTGWGPSTALGEECDADHHADRGRRSTCGWEIYPPGLSTVLRRYAPIGVPILITENGLATEDEEQRRVFLAEHIESVAKALASGVDVIGYIYWSLLDNYEWDLGFTQRFGLAGVDFRTQQRKPRPAAELYAAVCRSNELPIDWVPRGD